ncbi:LacI family DNA-binding transcriptional regulator [Microbacterium sp.]|uniref:LacI family DNA-binding transcriptional regulator n=1 Tax=Microbacterium sp. TaxID=51671 RepID=UPI002810C54A|nr:LacI family DNA-binding transcriptional regulator [Microbacterium sp.]
MPTARPRAVTMADIAKEAGVSRATVSFVLNDREDVAIPEATRARVRRIAADRGYRPNAAARGLARQRSGWYGLVTEIVTSPLAVQVIRGAQQQAWAEERFLLIAPSDDEWQMESAAIEKLLEQRVEGVIIAATWHRPVVVPPNAYDVPCVLVNCFDAKGILPSIVPDEVSGGRTAAQVLIEAGHQRIGHVTLEPGIPAQVGRLDGFRRTLAEAGITLDEELIVAGDGSTESGYRGGVELLERDDAPTAIFCGNDRMAMGVYDAAKERDIRIPEDLSIVGFDDQQFLAESLRPGLTTVALPFEEMGARGVSMLTSLTAGSAIDNAKVEIDCPLRLRSSVGSLLR